MEREVIYRDRQELTAEDNNNSQAWGAEAQNHLVTDAITPEKQFVGLTVTQRSATEIEVATGRLYTGPDGKVFALTSAKVISVFAHLPVQDERWLAVSVYGQEEETDVQPRDFLVDLETGQTEPDNVAMERRRVVVTHIATGLESPTPEKPEPPTGYTLIGYVRMNDSGIQEIALPEAFKLPNLHKVEQRVKTVEGWQLAAEPRIASIMSDIAGLGDAMARKATIEQALQLALDMANVKERLEIPDDYKFYGSDHFLSDDESDTDAVGYDARLDEGVRPPLAATDTVSLALLNPVDPAAKVSADGLLLPAYTETARLRMETQEGDITINQYQYQDTQAVQRTVSRQRIQYGVSRTVCVNSSFWNSGRYDATSGIFRVDGEAWEVHPDDRANAALHRGQIRLREFWFSTYTESYWDHITTTHTVQGSILAQTVLMAQTGWMTSIELYFTHVDPAGGMTLLITDASLGQPDLNKAIARVTLAANALNSGWCKISLPTPTFVEAGKRYAIVLVTGSQHKVGYTKGTEYTQGVLLYAQDNDYFNQAADRDLMIRLNFARFSTPRAQIQMQPLQLAGGIADLDMIYDAITPDGTALQWEYQVAGNWYPIASNTAENLDTLPALLPIRAVFIGTTDLMPTLRLTGSQIIVGRPGTAFTHFSTTRNLSTASDDIRVRLLLENFDDTYHTVDCDLIIGGSPVNATSSKDEIVDTKSFWREYTFSLGSTTSAYEIKITGSTNDWRKAWHVAERYDLAL